jgi:dienelactone hydrolase
MSELERTNFRLDYASDRERVIRGRIVKPAGRAGPPFVILLHGFKGFMDWGFFPLLAERLAERGLAALSFNMSGSGLGRDLQTFSEPAAFERNTYSRELEDLELVRAHASRAAFGELDTARAGIFGHSRGGAIALLHAAERGDYRAVATWAALADLGRWDEATQEVWKRQGWIPIVNTRTGQEFRLRRDVLDDWAANRERFDVLAACRRLRAPALVVHGGRDDSVDPHAAEELAASLKDVRTLILPDAGHTFGATHPLLETGPDLERVLSATVGFFAGELGEASTRLRG